jgi:hypothetical protein
MTGIARHDYQQVNIQLLLVFSLQLLSLQKCGFKEVQYFLSLLISPTIYASCMQQQCYIKILMCSVVCGKSL